MSKTQCMANNIIVKETKIAFGKANEATDLVVHDVLISIRT